jgi:FK506-binding protein 1
MSFFRSISRSATILPRTNLRLLHSTARNMGVTKTIIAEGSGASPQKGDRVTMEYTGWLRTAGKPEEKGKQFDSTTGRGPFQTPIGVGRVIKGEFVSDRQRRRHIRDGNELC